MNDVYTANVVASAWAGAAHTAAQVTASKQPVIIASDSSYSGAATMNFASASSMEMALLGMPISQPLSICVVGESTSGGGTQEFAGPNVIVYYSGGWGYYAGTFQTTANATRTQSVSCGVFNGAASALYLKSPTAPISTGNPGTNAWSTSGEAIGSGSGGAFLNGKIAEIVFTGVSLPVEWRERIFTYAGNRYGFATAN